MNGSKWRIVMLSIAALVALLAVSIGAATPANAAPPPAGVVVEGHSVPGVALGATRASATSAWGQPSYCQGATSSLCTYNLTYGATTVGSADLTFAGPNGAPPTGGPTDIVATIDWIGFPWWRTTAGVTTANALSRPYSVVGPIHTPPWCATAMDTSTASPTTTSASRWSGSP